MRIIITIAICIALASCKNKKNICQVNTEVTAEIVEKSDSLFTKQYAVAINNITEKAALDFTSLGFAKHYKTQIRQGYSEGKINFAGHYIVIKWGCGMGCLEGVIADVRNGKMYEIPRDAEWEITGNEITFKANSTYMITAITGFFEEKGVFTKQKHWAWNENIRKFDFIRNDKVKETIPAQE